MRRIRALLLLAPLLCGLSAQPLDERAAQEALPISRDTLWTLLGRTDVKFNGDTGYYEFAFPDEVKALDGTEITITGFMLPLDMLEVSDNFLLSMRTPTCPFCPPGEPDEYIDTHMLREVSWVEEAVTVTGRFSIQDGTETGMPFRLDGGKLVEGD
jgi:hypothetical protein